jgi:pyruvate dehydrogenase E2 component (dihydrolipoamide acetyltransferase)
MPIPITVPRLGWTMEEGIFGGWLKREGDDVEAGELLFTLEGEKASQEIEAIDGGVLHIPPGAPQTGDVVAVGAVLAYLFAPGERPSWETGAGVGPAAPRSNPSGPGEAGSDAPPPPATAGGRAGRNPEPDPAREPAISPRARRAARKLGVEWRSLSGTGRTGRIREKDVQQAVARRPASQERTATEPRLYDATDLAAASQDTAHQAQPVQPGRRSSISRMRRAIANRMRASLATTAPVTLTSDADVTNLVVLRRGLPAQAGYTDLIVKLTAAVLERHPLVMAQWHDDALVIPDDIHIGIAVDTDDGLLVPVLRDVLHRTLEQIAADARELIEAARAGRIAADKLSGGVFTVTNLGMHGIDAFTPIIHAPQSAILGIGRIRREPCVVGDAIVPRDRMTLSLTFDHRVIDGAPAARFLADLRRAIEEPAAVLDPGAGSGGQAR